MEREHEGVTQEQETLSLSMVLAPSCTSAPLSSTTAPSNVCIFPTQPGAAMGGLHPAFLYDIQKFQPFWQQQIVT